MARVYEKQIGLLMTNPLFYQDIISIKDLSLEQINLILKTATQLKQKPANNLLSDKIIAHCFFEPSTRTRLSFETATLRLGGQVIGFADAENLSVKKGETLYDTIKVIDEYADLIVIRHPQEGAARLAAEIATKPVINAGDAANQHPTQALVDLFTVQACQKELDGLNIALVGDLKYGRTIHSFAQICALFNIRLFLVSPEALALPEYICDELKKKSVKFSFHKTIEEIIDRIDILYMTRIQQERFGSAEFQAIKNQFVLTPKTLEPAKDNLKILHPLPRVNEIDITVDALPYAHYFQQAANGVCVRQALLTLLLNK